MQTEILRSYNEARGFRNGSWKMSARWPEKKQWIDDIVQWGEKGLVRMVRQAKNREGYRCLVHEVAYARTSGTAS